MAALTGNQSLLFTIRADGDQAVRELQQTKAEVQGLGTAASTAGPLIATALTVAATAAASAAVGVFNLTKRVAEAGSQIYDLSVRTGLSATSLSALKYAADTSGSSIESIAGSVAKFNVLVGKASQDNEKAKDTLEQYGITARTTDEALAQAIKTIASYSDHNQKAAAAAALFKDKTGEILPVIDSFSGDLPGLISKLKELGLVLSDEDAKAADSFGDTLDTLTKQAGAVAKEFAYGLMPSLTSAMSKISAAMAQNQVSARSWGEYYGTIMRGVVVYTEGAASGISAALSGIARAFGANEGAAKSWGATLVSEFGKVIASGGLLFYILGKIGAANPDPGEMGPPNMDKPVMPSIPIPKLSGGTGGGGGPTSSGASAPKRDLFAEAQKQNQILIDAYQAGADRMEAINNQRLANAEISEIEHVKELARINMARLLYEKELAKQITELNSFKETTDENKAEAIAKIGLLDTKISTQQIKNAIDLGKAEADALDQAAADLVDMEQLREKFFEAEKKRIQELKEEDNKRFNEWIKQRDAAIQAKDPFNLGGWSNASKKKKAGDRTADDWEMSGGDNFLTGILDGLGLAQKQLPALQQMGEMLAQTFGQVANAIGSVVQNFVLMGTTGPAFLRKMLAATLASVAAESAVRAVFELAKGFASLFFNPGEAAAHFQAAALFGSIAVGSGIAGRVTAGNLFSQETGSTASSNNSNGNQQNNSYTSGVFGGFQNRLNQTMVVLEEAVTGFTNKIVSMRPGDVLAKGVDENPGAVSDGLIGGLQNNSRLTGALMRATGMAR